MVYVPVQRVMRVGRVKDSEHSTDESEFLGSVHGG